MGADLSLVVSYVLFLTALAGKDELVVWIKRRKKLRIRA